LGMKLIYLDAGSGALNPVPDEMIQAVRKSVDVPIIVGGGIRDSNRALQICKSGADIIVLGNAIEKKASLIASVSEAIKRL
ncbi:MAG TPA: geranylgeranylglyceryl/heptaprenylglyceryl phosphate synthase, partial [Bacteroidales bacterium]|nr:geranylgeranylglyceryl/heptaprenylglyceryl phosphate synthase [Bacteroidales bacterium]